MPSEDSTPTAPVTANASEKTTPGSKGFANLDAKAKEQARLKANLGRGNSKDQAAKILLGVKGEKQTLESGSFDSKATLYFKDCEDSEFVVDAQSTKVMIESCHNCKVILNGQVMTNVAEIWKCNGSTLTVNTRVETIQADLCKGLNLEFKHKGLLNSIIWAGVYDMNISFLNGGTAGLLTGFEQMKESHPDINDQIDQFITRWSETRIGSKLNTEKIVRLVNGYPTTEREAKEFDEREEKNKKLAEKKIKQLIKSTETVHREKGNVTHTNAVKVGRNENCTCGSGKKFKKCCGAPGKQVQQTQATAPGNESAKPASEQNQK